MLCSLPDSWDSLVVAIGRNKTTLKFDEIVSSLLPEEMRQKNMEGRNGDFLFVRGRSQNKNKNKPSSGRSKSLGKLVKVCWKCEKEGHFKKHYRSKAPKKGKGSDDAPSAEAKTISDEGGDVYFPSYSSTHVDHEAWLINLGAFFHFTPPGEWLCEYDKYDGGEVFIGDGKKFRIVGNGKLKLKLQGGNIRTLPSVFYIPALSRNLIFVRNMVDASVKIMFKKGTFKMIWGALILMRGVFIGTLYKL